MRLLSATAVLIVVAMLAATAAQAGTKGPEPPAQITIAAVGDTMFGHTPVLPAHPETYVTEVNGAFADADLVFGNLEGTLSTAKLSKCLVLVLQRCYAYKMPPAWGIHLRDQGFDVMSSANNHSRDYGIKSEEQTTRALMAAGIAQTGLHGQIAVLTANEISVAFVAFSPYPRTAWMLDRPAARALIRQAGSMADIVVVYMHAGAEGADKQHVTGQREVFLGENRGNPRQFAWMAIKNGADLVIGSGPHVLRGMEFYRGRLIAYSLGDFAGFHNFISTGLLALSMILKVTLTADGHFVGGQIVPTLLDVANKPHPDPTAQALPFVAQLSTEDFGAAAAAIAADGTISPPLSP